MKNIIYSGKNNFYFNDFDKRACLDNEVEIKPQFLGLCGSDLQKFLWETPKQGYLSNREYGCCLQIGGSDQWGNIVAGTSLNRKMRLMDVPDEKQTIDNSIFGLTCPLLLTKEGKKMGKTESGTLWVAREKTTAYDFYQYFYNVDDGDVKMLLSLFTRVSSEEIESLCSSDPTAAKKVMAYEITKLVHGKEEADKVISIIQSLFSSQGSGDNAPESVFVIEENSVNVCDLFYYSGFVSSKGEIRRLIQQNGASVDGVKCESPEDIVTKPNDRNYVVLKKGKKSFLKVNFR